MKTKTAPVAVDVARPRPGPLALLAGARRGRRKLGRRVVPYVFSLPFLTLFAAFFFLPFAYAFSQSVFKQQRSGLGLGPPTRSSSGARTTPRRCVISQFWDGIKRVLLFGAVQIPVMMIVALVLALLMDSAVIRFRRFFRLAFFIPYAVPGVVAGSCGASSTAPASAPSSSSRPRRACRRPISSGRPGALVHRQHLHLGVHRLQHGHLLLGAAGDPQEI